MLLRKIDQKEKCLSNDTILQIKELGKDAIFTIVISRKNIWQKDIYINNAFNVL